MKYATAAQDTLRSNHCLTPIAAANAIASRGSPRGPGNSSPSGLHRAGPSILRQQAARAVDSHAGDPRQGRGARRARSRSTLFLGAILFAHSALLAAQSPALGTRATAVDAGFAHTCMRSTEGAILCWGDNSDGQIGTGAQARRALAPVVVPELSSGMAMVSAGGTHSCAVSDAGAAVCWGSNRRGQLGDGTLTSRPTPAPVNGLESGVLAVSAGGEHSCAVLTTGRVRCWGSNDFGQLGTGTTSAPRLLPTNVAGLSSGVSHITAGSSHSCAIRGAGELLCWGINFYGAIGDGSTSPRYFPVSITGLPGPVSVVVAGGGHTCATVTPGGMHCWGYNADGALGDGTNISRNAPVPVLGFGAGASTLALGWSFTCGSRPDGSLECWGRNEFGQLGIGSVAAQGDPRMSVPTAEPVTAISAGHAHACAVTVSGDVHCWGWHDADQVGWGRSASRTVPTEIDPRVRATTFTVSSEHHTCAQPVDGVMHCWGANRSGQLGDGTTTTRPLPTPVVGLPSLAIAGSAGTGHTCALSGSGRVDCWGDNYYGQLGDGTRESRTTPAAVQGLTSGVRALASGDNHTCAVTDAGSVLCWGSNTSGQGGQPPNNVSNLLLVPMQVASLSAGNVAIAAGDSSTCALSGDGKLMCWGNNTAGELGDGTFNGRWSPAPVLGLPASASGVSARTRQFCAVLVDGRVFCWGGNQFGQNPVPVGVTGFSTEPESVSVGSRHSCALLAGGSIQCWGGNYFGQLGDGTTNDSPATPTAVAGTARYRHLNAGFDHSCGVTLEGQMHCWGRNTFGQLGIGSTGYATSPSAVLQVGGFVRDGFEP
ncbi:MAG: hypothetical protein LW860_13965 [Xanthomonadaceae bacterium]|jgi:alpha-tubulin suppressor-like RCC1 family protein|nr:hypothetical protein [Xanthomonadaceae bacterium]